MKLLQKNQTFIYAFAVIAMLCSPVLLYYGCRLSTICFIEERIGKEIPSSLINTQTYGNYEFYCALSTDVLTKSKDEIIADYDLVKNEAYDGSYFRLFGWVDDSGNAINPQQLYMKSGIHGNHEWFIFYDAEKGRFAAFSFYPDFAGD